MSMLDSPDFSHVPQGFVAQVKQANLGIHVPAHNRSFYEDVYAGIPYLTSAAILLPTLNKYTLNLTTLGTLGATRRSTLNLSGNARPLNVVYRSLGGSVYHLFDNLNGIVYTPTIALQVYVGLDESALLSNGSEDSITNEPVAAGFSSSNVCPGDQGLRNTVDLIFFSDHAYTPQIIWGDLDPGSYGAQLYAESLPAQAAGVMYRVSVPSHAPGVAGRVLNTAGAACLASVIVRSHD